MHGRGRRSHLQALEFVNTTKMSVNCSILPEQFATNRLRRLRKSRVKKNVHQVFASEFQIRAVQCLLQGRVCSDVAPHLDFAQFQSFQNGNFGQSGRRYRKVMKKVLVKLNPTKMRLRRDSSSLGEKFELYALCNELGRFGPRSLTV